MKKYFYLAMIAVFSCHGLSCGYSARTTLPANLRTIHVEPFKNAILYENQGNRNVYLPLLEQKVRNAIVNRFLFDGHLKATDPDRADVILKGELIGFERNALRLSDNENVTEYRIHVIVAMSLLNVETNELLWDESSFAGETTYFVSGPRAKSEEAAVQDAIADLARRIVERTIEDW